MMEKTQIAQALENSELHAKYDAEVKQILANRQLLAWIMKYSVKELMPYEIETIIGCIEEEPEVSAIPVYPGKRKEAKEKISGMLTEDKIPNEGEVTFDIRFPVMTPEGKRVKLMINIEAQKKFHTGYDLVSRGIFYCARMLSAQLDTEFTTDNYDEIKKVYSIWLCMDTPKNMEYTITEYHMEQHPLYGDCAREARYDLLSVIMICLGREEDTSKGNKLHRLLTTILSDKLLVQQKKKMLEQEYGFAMTRELDERMAGMCNLSELIEERGIKKGIEKGIEKGISESMEKMIQTEIAFQTPDDIIVKKLMKAFDLTEEQAYQKVQQKNRYH